MGDPGPEVSVGGQGLGSVEPDPDGFVFSAEVLSWAAAWGDCWASGPGARLCGALNNGGPAAPSPWPP